MERTPERKEAQWKMNLLADPEAVISAMARIEGPAWLELQDRLGQRLADEGIVEPAAVEETAHDSVIAAMDHLRGLGEIDLQTPPHRIYTVYGNGGVNRWFIYSDGTVKFSESHAQSPEHLAKAKELGFEIIS